MATRTYTKPVFNLLCSKWTFPNKPSVGAADFTGVPAQLYYNSISFGTTQVQVRVDVNAVPSVVPFDMFECPSGSGLFFKVTLCEWMHKDFPNEYWSCVSIQTDSAGTQGSHLP